MMEQGFIYQIINAVVQSIAAVTIGVCLENLLTGREDRASRGKRITFWVAITSFLTCAKCLFPPRGAWIPVGNPICMTLYYIFMLTYFYRDKPWIKIAHASVLILQNVFSDAFLLVVLGEVKEMELFHLDFANPYMAERSAIIASLSLLLNVIYTAIVLKIRKKGKGQASPLWIAALLPMFLILLMIWGSRGPQVVTGDSNWYFILLCIWSVLEFALVMLYLSQMEKREMQAEEARLAQAMALERVHYEQIEARREEMAKLRHDYNNILTSVLFLVKNERTDEAGAAIKELLERIRAAEEE
ncbi:hypothetical protein ABXS75_17175 [Roseburia hominis]